MHELTVFCMDVDVTVEVYPAALHVASNAITGLQECYTRDRIGWHFDAVWGRTTLSYHRAVKEALILRVFLSS